MAAPHQHAAPQIYDHAALNNTPAYADISTHQSSSMAGDRIPAGGTVNANNFIYLYQSTQDLLSYANGRIFNNQNDTYALPSDDEEFQRLDKQHYAIKICLGSSYPARHQVEAILKEDPHQQKSILDLGTGTGIWAIEMARGFPHAEVIGVDLAPVPVNAEEVPPNCRFEIDDINLGLTHFHGQFDLIHVRCVGSGITNFARMMRDVERCLKPGGMVIFIDGDMRIYDEDTIRAVPLGSEDNVDGTSWMFRMVREMRYAAILNGADVDGLENGIDEGLWRHAHLIDPDTCGAGSLSIPLGPWATVPGDVAETHRLLFASSLLRQAFFKLSRALHTLLLIYGLEQEVLDTWSSRVDTELLLLRFRMCFRWRMCWGRRRAADGEPAPPLPLDCSPMPPTSESPTPTFSRLQLLGEPIERPGFESWQEYKDEQECLRFMQARKNGDIGLPMPSVMELHEQACLQ